MSDSKLPIWTYPAEAEGKHALPQIGRSPLQITEVDPKLVTSSLKRAIAAFDPLVQDAPSTGGFEIESIELHFGISASGAVALIGKLEAGMEASIKVTLKRSRLTIGK
ncbi:hypothetical protein ACFPN2_28290 [Steroidobacter flavus]|uniref:Pepco domain-containing protein n=1 Tax=Steroidobacter flavus TaxID=1842136 RepID=A0ABV8T025_9GAMM